MKKLIFLLAVFLLPICLFAQNSDKSGAHFITELTPTKGEPYKKETGRKSTFKTLGKTNASIIVQEEVLIEAKSSYDYSFEAEIILHYYDLTGTKKKFSKTVWSHENPDGEAKAVKSLYIGKMPSIIIFSNQVYVYTNTWRPEHSQQKGKNAIVIKIFKESANKIEERTTYFHSKESKNFSFELNAADDESYLYAYSFEMGKKEDRKKYKTPGAGLFLFNKDMEEVNYIFLHNMQNIHVFNDMITYVGRKSDGKRSAREKPKAYLKIIWLNNLQTDEIPLNVEINSDGSLYIESQSLGPNSFVSKEENKFTFLYSNICTSCSKEKKLEFYKLTVNINDGRVEDFERKKLVYQFLEESGDNEQEDFQEKLFSVLHKQDVRSSDVYHGNFKKGDKFNGGCSGQVAFYEYKMQARTLITFAFFVLDKHIDSVYMAHLSFRISYGNSAISNTPFYVGNIDGENTFVGNYLYSTKSDDKYVTYQIVQRLTFNISEESVVRVNLSDVPDSKGEIVQFNCDVEDHPILFEDHVICIGEDTDGKAYLSKIVW